jgi:hypothetical protein
MLSVLDVVKLGQKSEFILVVDGLLYDKYVAVNGVAALVTEVQKLFVMDNSQAFTPGDILNVSFAVCKPP